MNYKDKRVCKRRCGFKKSMDRHHRAARSKHKEAGIDVYSEDNISVVPVNQHRAFHLLFSNKLPQEIAQILNETWIQKNVKFVVVPR
jgi:hypothetical protein